MVSTFLLHRLSTLSFHILEPTSAIPSASNDHTLAMSHDQLHSNIHRMSPVSSRLGPSSDGAAGNSADWNNGRSAEVTSIPTPALQPLRSVANGHPVTNQTET